MHDLRHALPMKKTLSLLLAPTSLLVIRTGTSYQFPPPGRVGGGMYARQPGRKSGNSEAMTVLLVFVYVLRVGGMMLATLPLWHKFVQH